MYGGVTFPSSTTSETDPNSPAMLQLIEEQELVKGMPHGKVTSSPNKANIIKSSVEEHSKIFNFSKESNSSSLSSVYV